MNRKDVIENLKNRLNDLHNGYQTYLEHGGKQDIETESDIEALNMAIEALQEPEIVHCKDCKLRKLEECAMQYECDCGEQHSWENDNDYCSWGIKAGEQK